MSNSLPSERTAIVGVIDPDAYPAETYTSGWADLAKFGRILAIVTAGTLGASATLNAKLEQAKLVDGVPGTPKDVTGKAITALTQAGTDSDKQALINCRDDELDVAGGYQLCRLSMTIAVATSDAGALVLGFDPRNAPASDYDLASVDEIVK